METSTNSPATAILNYNLMILNLINIQQNQITTNLKEYSTLITSLNEIIKKDDNNDEIPVFSRLDIQSDKKCGFCTKTPYYQDLNNKLYCWFHRSQFED